MEKTINLIFRWIGINIALWLCYLFLAMFVRQALFGVFFWVSIFPIFLLVNIFCINREYNLYYIIFSIIVGLIAWVAMVYLYPFPESKGEEINSYHLLYQIDLYGFAIALGLAVFYVLLDFARNRRGIAVGTASKNEIGAIWLHLRIVFSMLLLFFCIPNLLWIFFLSMLGDIQNIRVFLPIPLSALLLVSFQTFPLILIFNFNRNRGLGLMP